LKFDQLNIICIFCVYSQMYWTDWSKNARIEMCGMNGVCPNRDATALTKVGNIELGWPNGLTIGNNPFITEKLKCSLIY